MLGINFLIRTALAGVVFYFLVLVWALAPALNDDIELNITVLSIFFGTVTSPTGLVRDLLCLARGLFGMIIVIYIFLPGLRVFFQYEAEKYSNTINLVLAGVMVLAFLGSIVAFNIYYL